MLVLFELFSGLMKYFELCMETKPRVSYFPWTHTEIQDNESWVSLQFMICHRSKKKQIRQWKMENGDQTMENGKWKMENGGLANSAT